MNEQRLTRCHAGKQVLASSIDRGHRLAGESCREARRKRPPEIGAPNVDAYDPRAAHRAVKRPAHRFDFRQFGHTTMIAAIVAPFNEDPTRRRPEDRPRA
jgi:hypothetical protein